VKLLPDVERVLVDFLRAQPELQAELGDRIYTVLPTKPTFPAVRVGRWGGWAAISRPLVLDEGWCQVDTWGGTKAEASHLARLMRALIDQRLRASGAPVSAVRFGMFHDAPDQSYEPARPHWRFDVSLMLRPEAAPPPPVPRELVSPGPPNP
jgi:hypothetical protein